MQNNPRYKLYKLLGDLPEKKRKIYVIKSQQIASKNYFLEKIVLDLNGIEPVPAYFLLPKKGDKNLPVILYNHAHGGDYILGKDELIKGRKILTHPPYADDLAKNGYAVLCIDAWGFGERSGKSESKIFKEMLWNGRVLWGMMVYDSLRALDYICQRTEIDKKRIATIGMSMGSTMAWWISALDKRVKVCIDICCLTDYQSLMKEDGLDRHGLYYFVPKLLKYFTAAEINSLIAPRPHLSLAGLEDKLTPIKGLKKIDKELKKIYKSVNSADSWKLLTYPCGHQETKQMRLEILKFLKKHL